MKLCSRQKKSIWKTGNQALMVGLWWEAESDLC